MFASSAGFWGGAAMKTIRLTMAQALVKWLCAQRTVIEGAEAPLFGGVFAIFGHGNVTCLGEALEAVQDQLPTWRGQNEQSMALAGIAYAKARKRRQIMVATSSIGPGAMNMVTAAGVAHSNRLPILLLAGDTFANRVPDPVLQQVEHFHDPTITVNDAFKAVTRYWDRIARPEQIIGSLPQAVATMLDPADCGPAFLALCQDTQAEAFDYLEAFFEPKVWRVPRPRPDVEQLVAAAELLRKADQPLIVAGGGVHYSLATAELATFALTHRVPVVETIAGRACLPHDHPSNAGPLGVIGSASANALAAEADVVLAVGTRLQDFTTGSWTVFGNPEVRLIALNAARFDAAKHRALAVVGDAKEGLVELSAGLAGWRAPQAWLARAAKEYAAWNAIVDQHSGPTNAELPSYAHVVGAINRACAPTDLALTAAGGLPGELCKNWKAKTVGTFDCEFGFSCMGYEIAGGWGARMADPERDVIVFCGDGSYLMMNSDIYSSVLTGHKLIVVVCDNGGFAVINRLQNFKGSASFNNLLEDCRRETDARVDFARHAESMGAIAERVRSIGDLEAAFARAKAADRTYVIVIDVHPHQWTPGDAWWDVAVPEVSRREAVKEARAEHERGWQKQRIGV
jgi:3D-(3,5/4)-trihydroxycyclohexane-1,2-dione acylhydrolase (decyclizing)